MKQIRLDRILLKKIKTLIKIQFSLLGKGDFQPNET